jgi:predicted RNA binding protein YcfA (HicA-like mRNA interferase family)
MRLPRDLSGQELARVLHVFGYTITRQTGSHLRLTTLEQGEHHVTIPNHNPIKVGTLSGILTEVAGHLKLEKSELQQRLFG